jgi:hypothetical protein
MARSTDRWHSWLPLAVFVAVMAGHLPLVLNPGYFSHDEFQWAAYALEGRSVSWTQLDAFQFRPLTFNLWLVLSAALFDKPEAFHAVLVAAGAINATLVFWLARALGAKTWPAVAGSLVFALGPYATFVHGWVGTLADLIWVAAALLIGLLTASRLHAAVVLLGTLVLTTVGLLAKEAAVAIPGLLAIAWLATSRDPRWGIAMLASGVIIVIYLALRLDTLLAGAVDNPSYAVGLHHLPLRWLEYQFFPLMVTMPETYAATGRGIREPWLWVAAALWCVVLAATWRSSRKLAFVFLAGGFIALLPALPLPAAATQYGYGYSAVAVLAVATAWPLAPPWGRAAMALAGILILVHGMNVARHVRHVGQLQSVFSPALAEVLVERDSVLRLSLEYDPERWAFLRLTHGIPHYRGVRFGERVEIVAPDEPSDATIRRDGSIEVSP